MVLKGMIVPEGIAVRIECGEGLEASLDPKLIQRVLENLIRNAEEAMPGGGELKVSVHRVDEKMVIDVSDSGSGIPKEARAKIFTPLYTSKPKGVGLGLSFCKRVVEAHGGTIDFSSKVGQGTTFSIKLPTS